MKSNNEFGDLLFKISRLFRCEMNFNGYAARLSMLQLHALIFLKQREKVHMSDIADNFRIEMPTATSLVNKLVTLRLVKRIADRTDRRVVQIALTQKGSEVLEEAEQQRNKKLNMMLSVLTKDDKQKLYAILKKVINNLEKQYET